MKSKRYNYKLLFILLIFSMFLISNLNSFVAQPNNLEFFARVDYIVVSEENGEVTFNVNEVKEINAPIEPTGYKLYYMEVDFNNGLPQGLVAVSYDKVVEKNNLIRSLFSYTGTVKLAANKENITTTITVKAFFIKREWLPLKSGEIKLKIDPPSEPFTAKNLTVRVTIDNFAPFAFVGLLGPNGENLIDTTQQENMAPDAVKLDFKHLELNMRELSTGTYTLLVKEDKSFVLPNSFIVVEDKMYNTTIKASSESSFTVKQKEGWRTIGAIVILYSIAPSGTNDNYTRILGEMIDYVFKTENDFTVTSASFLVPPLYMKYWVKAYVVYGSWFRVQNYMKSPVNMIYIPISIKETGKWTPQGLTAEVKETDIKKAYSAYLVVQIPSFGRIKSITTPGGETYTNYREAVKSWFGGIRTLAMFENEAFIQVKNKENIESGVYRVAIDWTPLTFKLIDNSERPLVNALLVVLGESSYKTVTNVNGTAKVLLYKPGIYHVTAKFKGVNVGSLDLGTITDTNFTLKCSVYDLKIITVGMMQQTLSGTDVVLKTMDGATLDSKETNTDGVAVFTQVPKGEYIVEATYKRIHSKDIVKVYSDTVYKMKMDLLFEIPGIGLPLTSSEAVASIVSIGATSLLLLLAKRRKGNIKEERHEIDVEI